MTTSREDGGARKAMPFMARKGDWPTALSRAPACGVHRSAAKTLYRRSGGSGDQAQGLARKGGFSFMGRAGMEGARSAQEKFE